MPPQPPAILLGRYRLGEVIGSGGLGVVHRAIDPALDRHVAIKLVKTADRVVEQARLVREAQALARVSHVNVVQLFDVGTYDDTAGLGPGGVFIVMELVEGETLRNWVHRSDPGWRRIVDALVQAGRGLDAAHRNGLVHRDFKPGNVLVDGHERVRVLDFGLARNTTGENLPTASNEIDAPIEGEDLTATGTVVGTPAYMAPEQIRGEALDARADQFSFCVALWELLYGARPFPGLSLDHIATLARRGPPRRPVDTDVPEPLHEALVRGLAYDRDARFRSMRALLAALRRASRPGWRRPAWWLPAVLGVFVLGLMLLPTPPRGVGARESEAGSEARDTAAEQRVHDAITDIEEGRVNAAKPILEELAAEPDGDVEVRAAALYELARVAVSVNDRTTARSLFDQAIALAQSRRDDIVFEALVALAGLDARSDRFDDSARSIERATDLIQRLPPEPGRVGVLRAAEAQLAHARGEQDEAVRLAREAVNELDQALTRPRDEAAAWRVLGSAHLQLGARAEAMTAFRHSADVIEAEYGRAHPDLARSLLGLALALKAAGRREEERAVLEEAVAVAQASDENISVLTAASLHLGSHYLEMGDRPLARGWYEYALDAALRAVDRDPVTLTGVLNNLGELQIMDGDYQGAADSVARALTIVEESNGPDSPEAMLVRINYATALLTAGDLDRARAQAQRMLDSKLPAEVRSTALLVLLQAELAGGDAEEAWHYAEQWLAEPAEGRGLGSLWVARAARASATVPRARKLELAREAARLLVAERIEAGEDLVADPEAWVDAE